jgi:hypothetical protein
MANVREMQAQAWNIGLSAWIIQDGNYPDFAVGDIVEFAVEYYQEPSTHVTLVDAEPSARLVRDSLYDAVAEKVLQTGDITVLNIGILVYREAEQAAALGEPETRFQTQLHLGIDPFFYFERLSKIPGVPPLVYSWRIAAIHQQTAPFVESTAASGPHAGRPIMVRDRSKLGYREIQKTNAWEDDNGFGEYVMRCELLPSHPKHVSATAT